VNDGPEPASDLVAGHRISDPPAYRVRHIHRRVFFGPIYETNSQWPALTSSGGCREKRELPSGSNPTGHPSLRPSIGDDPCYDGPSERRDRREFAFERENHGFWLSSACLADKYASLIPLLKLLFYASRYPLGVAGALLATMLPDCGDHFSGVVEIRVWCYSPSTPRFVGAEKCLWIM